MVLLTPAILALLVSLLVHAPARLLAPALPANVPVVAWGGSLLNGQLNTLVQQKPLYIAWQWQPLALLRASLAAKLTLLGVVQTHAQMRKSALGWTLVLDDISLPPEAFALVSPGAVLPAWQGRGLHVARDHGGDWRDAGGTLQTTGGPLRLDLQGQIQELNLPASTLRWQASKGSLVGQLQQQSDNAVLATLTLTANNRIQWQIRDRMLRLKAGYVSKSDPDLIVLSVAQPL